MLALREIARGRAQSPADARTQRVIDGRMAQRAGNSHRLGPALGVEGCLDADDGIQLQQQQRHRRVVQVDLPALDGQYDALGQSVGIDLQAHRQRGLGANARPHAAVLGAGDRLVELKRVPEELLVAERVKPEDVAEIIESHIVNQIPVARLQLADECINTPSCAHKLLRKSE